MVGGVDRCDEAVDRVAVSRQRHKVVRQVCDLLPEFFAAFFRDTACRIVNRILSSSVSTASRWALARKLRHLEEADTDELIDVVRHRRLGAIEGLSKFGDRCCPFQNEG